MKDTSIDDLESFLRQQQPARLVSLLLELAQDHEAVRNRLERLQLSDSPDQLSASFAGTLNAWRQSSRYISYREAGEFGSALETWLEQVHRELMPKNPKAALALFESFIEADADFFERADDSGGSIGDALRCACRHWLQAAARCEGPAGDWMARLVRLASVDRYGARDELLRRSDLLLDEASLRTLVGLYESRLVSAMATPSDDNFPSPEVFKAGAALSLLSEALGDPDVMVRAVLSYSPHPNALQQEDFVKAYLAADRPADALNWLQGPWGQLEGTRQRLLSDTLSRLGRHDESASIRQNLFERSIAVSDLHRWLEQLPEASRPAALERARQLALAQDDPATAAALLLDIGDDSAAESMLLAKPGHIRGDNYGSLVPLAQTLRAQGRLRGETAIYRALLCAILNRAYARAYAHAAEYWIRLQEIAASGIDLAPLESHKNFEAAIRSRHGRKPAFWAHVNGKHSDPRNED